MTRIHCLVAAVLMSLSLNLQAEGADLYPLSSPAEQERFQALTEELRCPKCQNQNIADSDAPIAKDMREEVHRMLQQGASNEQVVDALVARFGEFVRYKPQLEPRTVLLWATPVIVVIVGLLVITLVVVRSRRNTETSSALTPEQRRRAEQILKDAEAP
ncbi:MAG: cytochrome c-type biogenesis protein [Marinobacter sp.]|uniref:cytochrome c-type biogenesis protein n=1 Tax=Marinobacter sp. TaxID=50741 RepID=UPI00299CDC44|nr:cytochrome c-type biogenesis protein [Marinobacter sp.]MDX1636307.1 cytochrome c-type biogenesis protein [Marinobacter sp.]